MHLANRRPDTNKSRRVALDQEIANLVAAVSGGLVSPSIGARLGAAERELEAIRSVPRALGAAETMRQVETAQIEYLKIVSDFGEVARQDISRARETIRAAAGLITVKVEAATAGRVELIASFGPPAALAEAINDAGYTKSTGLVAGA